MKSSVLRVDNVVFEKKDKKILKGVSIEARSGRLTAMLGPTGSGKTSLLNVISGRQRPKSGSVTLNGLAFNKARRRHLGFVQQQDVFFAHLTLAETLMFTANIRTPESVTQEEKQARIDEIVNTLHLNKCINTVIGNVFIKGLSGGEKKRASIACELINHPNILLLDEPTSGVDSFTAYAIATCLREYVRDSENIVLLSIHQPSSNIYNIFNDLVLIVDGKIAYNGSKDDVLPQFEKIGLVCEPRYNPADFLMECLHMDQKTIDKLREGSELMRDTPRAVSYVDGKQTDTGSILFTNGSPRRDEVTLNLVDGAADQADLSPDDIEMTEPFIGHDDSDDVKWVTSWSTQFKFLAKRSFKEQVRAFKEGFTLVQCIIVSIVSGLLFFQIGVDLKTSRDVLGLNFFTVGYWTFLPAMKMIGAFPAERPVLAKERWSGYYRLSAFYLGRIASEIPEYVVLPTIMYTFYYWIGAFGGVAQFFSILPLLILHSIACSVVGLFISVLAPDLRVAITSLFSYLISAYVFGGFFTQTEPSWLEWLKYCALFYYIYAYMVSIIMTQLPDTPCNETSVELFPQCTSNETLFVTSRDVLEQGNVYLDTGPLAAIICAYCVLIFVFGYIAMRFKRDKLA